MRMSELPSREIFLIVAAPPGQVWALVSDITRVGDWGGECVRAEWIDGAEGPAVGARFRGYQIRQNQKWETMSVVTEAEPGISFAWAVGSPENPAATWRYQLVPDGTGGTIVSYRAVIGPGSSRFK
jgi:uncharacterized protein YndB with AHSA1/START domain